MAARMTHMRLLVPDVKACIEFYRDRIGLEVLWADDEGNYASFKTGDLILALHRQDAMARALGIPERPADAEPHDRVALIFAVPSVDEAYRELVRRGVEGVAAPTDRPDWGIRTAHFRDPAGNLIEINRPL